MIQRLSDAVALDGSLLFVCGPPAVYSTCADRAMSRYGGNVNSKF